MDTATSAVLQYVIGAGIVGIIALVLRLDRKVAYQNGSIARVVTEFDQHCASDREDFRHLFDKVDEVREEQRRASR